jgi:hypothetical protein
MLKCLKSRYLPQGRGKNKEIRTKAIFYLQPNPSGSGDSSIVQTIE